MKATEVPAGSMKLLAPPDGACRICARNPSHPPEQPHDAQSIFYGMRFRMRYGRDGTWADAIAHCDKHVRELWRDGLKKRGVWTEPPAGVEPISEPIDG